MTEFLVALLASFLAGATNAVAGGGTLITFPALVWLSKDPIKVKLFIVIWGVLTFLSLFPKLLDSHLSGKFFESFYSFFC